MTSATSATRYCNPHSANRSRRRWRTFGCPCWTRPPSTRRAFGARPRPSTRMTSPLNGGANARRTARSCAGHAVAWKARGPKCLRPNCLTATAARWGLWPTPAPTSLCRCPRTSSCSGPSGCAITMATTRGRAPSPPSIGGTAASARSATIPTTPSASWARWTTTATCT